MELMLSGHTGPMEPAHMVMMAFMAPTAKLMVAAATARAAAMLQARVGSVAKAQRFSLSTVFLFVHTD